MFWSRKRSYKRPSGRSLFRRGAGAGGMFKRRQFFWQRRSFKIYLTLGIAGFFFLLYLICWSGIFTIQNIQTEGIKSLSAEQVKQIIQDQLSQRRFGLFSQSNLWFFNSKTAQDEIKNRYVVTDAQIKKRPLKTLKIVITEKESQITWVSGDQYYYLDSNGLAVKEVIVANITLVEGAATNQPDTTGEAMTDLSVLDTNLPIVYDLSNTKVKVGQAIVSPAIIQFIYQLKEKIASVNLEARAYQIPEPQGTEVRVVTSRGFDVYFDLQNDLDRQLANLDLVIKQKVKDKKINYIDLRFENRVYFK
ncbi:MAG: hypothetical protein WC480_03800 [Patescibacteria group bacterium]